MKFRAERSEFTDAAAWSLRTIGARATLPALSGVRMEISGDELILESTDLEISSRLVLPVQSEREGVALVPGRLLGDVVRNLPHAAVEAEMSDDRLHLECGRAKFDLRLMPAEDFPTMGAPSSDVTPATMKAEDFSRSISQVARAASTDDHRPVLTGILLESTEAALTLVATDSYRLAVRTLPWELHTAIHALVPRRALDEARRVADHLGSDVHLALENAQATMTFPDRRLTTRLIEGKFIDYRQLLPESWERRLRVNRRELLQVVKRVAVVGEANSSATPVTLHITPDAVQATAGNGELGEAEETLPGELEGEPLEISFNPRYLTDGLEAITDEEVMLEFRDPLKPAVIRPTDGDSEGEFLYLLMPVRL
jgi:DNA polymerase-3 subunit beta